MHIESVFVYFLLKRKNGLSLKNMYAVVYLKLVTLRIIKRRAEYFALIHSLSHATSIY